ncbi:hypothetical protein TNCV_1735521 [Trichonephila clavipes]|nr:hypothetical protein TNCV_1735521 [Trichonephila clavipes]
MASLGYQSLPPTDLGRVDSQRPRSEIERCANLDLITKLLSTKKTPLEHIFRLRILIQGGVFLGDPQCRASRYLLLMVNCATHQLLRWDIRDERGYFAAENGQGIGQFPPIVVIARVVLYREWL